MGQERCENHDAINAKDEEAIYVTLQPVEGFGVIMKGEDMPHTISPLTVEGLERISLVLSYNTSDGDYCLENDISEAQQAMVCLLGYEVLL